MTSPSFSMYRHYAEIQGAQLVEVQTRAEQDFAIDVDAILAACDDTTRVIFVCSPNNPTGTTLPRDELVRLLHGAWRSLGNRCRRGLHRVRREPSVTELLGRYDNLLVLRTLSKALGFAGARCGAVAGPQDVIRMLSAVQAPYALATPVVECVEDALQDRPARAGAEEAVHEIIAERERLAAALKRYDFVHKVWPSDANFLLVRVDDAATRHAALRRRTMFCYATSVVSSQTVFASQSAAANENDQLLGRARHAEGEATMAEQSALHRS